MIESSPGSSNGENKLSDVLDPEVAIKFDTISELKAFEDIIAAQVNPLFDQEVWRRRPSIESFIKPSRFNGRLSDITLTPMKDPIDDFRATVDANERFQQYATPSRRDIYKYRQWKSYFLGFNFSATPLSSASKINSTVGLKIWYTPVIPLSGEGFGPVGPILDKDGNTVRRIITKPRQELVDRIDAVHDVSRTIGYEILSKALQNPLPVTIRN